MKQGSALWAVAGSAAFLLVVAAGVAGGIARGRAMADVAGVWQATPSAGVNLDGTWSVEQGSGGSSWGGGDATDYGSYHAVWEGKDENDPEADTWSRASASTSAAFTVGWEPLQDQAWGAASAAEATSAPRYFERDLTVGDEGPDVLALQRFLNEQGYTVAADGPGSPGYETGYFGYATQAALRRFQILEGVTPATGYFGPLTRGRVSGSSR